MASQHCNLQLERNRIFLILPLNFFKRKSFSFFFLLLFYLLASQLILSLFNNMPHLFCFRFSHSFFYTKNLIRPFFIECHLIYYVLSCSSAFLLIFINFIFFSTNFILFSILSCFLPFFIEIIFVYLNFFFFFFAKTTKEKRMLGRFYCRVYFSHICYFLLFFFIFSVVISACCIFLYDLLFILSGEVVYKNRLAGFSALVFLLISIRFIAVLFLFF